MTCGVHPASKFRRVLELIFEEGRLVRGHDLSERVGHIQERIVAGEQRDPDGARELHEWIARTFGLDYSRTFG